MLPAPEKVFLRPIAMALGGRFIAVALLGVARIQFQRFGCKYVAPQAFDPIENARYFTVHRDLREWFRLQSAVAFWGQPIADDDGLKSFVNNLYHFNRVSIV
jgi:hypothetical protein